MPDLSLKKINNLFSMFPPNSLTTVGHRVPDMLMFSMFNINNIPTFFMQHGLPTDGLQRLPLWTLICNKLGKFIKYILYAYNLCKINNLPLIKTMYEIYTIFINRDR